MTDKDKLLKANGTEMYPKKVAEYIHERYSQDTEFALINNYNADPEEHGEEYAEYQAYRAECKARAKRDCGLVTE